MIHFMDAVDHNLIILNRTAGWNPAVLESFFAHFDSVRIASCAAARRAMGTRYGEQLT